jgi:pimeloyl-ACP methyl ester carboxylesterase
MGFINARGSDFYYEEQGEGPPILLIPPAGSTASTWGALVSDLGRAGRVIAYDRRGYSRSGGETVRSASEHALDAAAVLEALAARPAVVVGTSAGATIALDLAVRRPDLVRAVVVHEAAWRALRHPDASGLGALARMQWLAWRGRYPEAAETLLRWVYSYRDGGSAWDAFPEQSRRTARENGRSVVADLKSSMGGYPPRPGPGDDHRTGRVHLWVAQPRLYALHHALTGPGHSDGKGAGDRRRCARRPVRRAGQLRPGHRRNDALGGSFDRLPGVGVPALGSAGLDPCACGAGRR